MEPSYSSLLPLVPTPPVSMAMMARSLSSLVPTIIVALRIVFCLFTVFFIKKSQFSSDEKQIEDLELENVNLIEAGPVPHVLADEAPEGEDYGSV